MGRESRAREERREAKVTSSVVTQVEFDVVERLMLLSLFMRKPTKDVDERRKRRVVRQALAIGDDDRKIVPDPTDPRRASFQLGRWIDDKTFEPATDPEASGLYEMTKDMASYVVELMKGESFGDQDSDLALDVEERMLQVIDGRYETPADLLPAPEGTPTLASVDDDDDEAPAP